ncbi:hypothetical protein [Kaistella jeonii]|uniref:Uncharacterized protein n=1 Tax=Kaistella jeonii TaxID=266749 RepID=A0A0C1D7N5_9FLAO|nr:hypothetical protein [Kaistella jeonii]KIA89905.1 hypothetical protein OA86_04640 [Kaistella jeonii]SFB81425.1 hypothetical protein SAMN05421876_102368 [Kaistella jeonii]VEI96148.1 Uncharacterised protein [Kaistella jeonii]
MQAYIIIILQETFSKYYGLQEALQSEDKLVADEALTMLSKFTGFRKSYILENLDKILEIKAEKYNVNAG